MTSVKKVYQPLVDFLESNKDKKVSTLMAEILALTESKQQSVTFQKDDNGQVTKIFCYYHKVWEDISEHEYGLKKNTASGYNTMCKLGLRNWTKQQSTFRKQKEQLLDKVVAGTISPAEVETILLSYEEERTRIIV